MVGVGREVFDTRSVWRKPKDERWDAARIQRITATPWRNPAPEGGDVDPAVLPPFPADEAAAVAPPSPLEPERQGGAESSLHPGQ